MANEQAQAQPMSDEERQELMDRLREDDQIRAKQKSDLEDSLNEEVKTLITSDAYKEVRKGLNALVKKATLDTRFNNHLQSASIILGNLEDATK